MFVKLLTNFFTLYFVWDTVLALLRLWETTVKFQQVAAKATKFTRVFNLNLQDL